MATLENIPVGFKDVDKNWPRPAAMRFQVGDDEFHRIGFFSNAEKLYRGLEWQTVQGWLVKGEIEATEADREYLGTRGIRLESVNDKPGFYRSVEPIYFKSNFIMQRGYLGKK